MKTKTIKSILSKVHNQLVESITDEKVKELVRKNSIITGGSIASMLLKEEVNDYDFYFTNRETVEAVAKYYVNQFNKLNPNKGVEPQVFIEEDRVRIKIAGAGIVSADTILENEEDTKTKHQPIFLSSNAITLSGKIQLVIRFYGSPEDIHDNFDYVHAMSWWRSEDDHLETPTKALLAMMTKELIYHGSKYPLASIIRSRKFIQRGWTIDAGQYLKMVLQLNELDLNNVDVLEEQLTGMDVAYFNEVLHKLRSKMESAKDLKVTSTYLTEIIDRIF